MTQVETAVHMYKSGCNCAQAIAGTYGAELGVTDALACKLATGFGGGMRMGETCGALAGAIMVLGLKYGAPGPDDQKAKARTYELVTELEERFRSRTGSTMCRDLLGCDISTPEGMKAAREKNRFTTLCPHLVQHAAEILEDIIKRNPA